MTINCDEGVDIGPFGPTLPTRSCGDIDTLHLPDSFIEIFNNAMNFSELVYADTVRGDTIKLIDDLPIGVLYGNFQKQFADCELCWEAEAFSQRFNSEAKNVETETYINFRLYGKSADICADHYSLGSINLRIVFLFQDEVRGFCILRRFNRNPQNKKPS